LNVSPKGNQAITKIRMRRALSYMCELWDVMVVLSNQFEVM